MNINGKVYDWSDVTVDIPGLNIEVQEITYGDELEKELVYGRGNKPRGYGTGNYKPNLKTTMLKEDFDELVSYCKRRRVPLYKLMVSKILVSYANESAPTVTDELHSCTPSKVDHKVAQGDKSATVDIDWLVVNGIRRNGLEAV